MADRYWVGGSGVWDSSSTANWSATSGGASGASAPTSVDDVIFNASSGGVGINSTFIAKLNAVSCKSLTMANFAATFNSSGTGDLTVFGSVSVTSATAFGNPSWSNTGANLIIDVSSPSILNIQPRFYGNVNLIANSSSITLTGDLTIGNISLGSGGVLTLVSGTFDAANYNVNSGRLNNNSGITRTLTMGSGVWDFWGFSGGVWNTTTTNLTFNVGTSTISFTGIAAFTFTRIFNGAGLTYYNLNLSAGQNPTIINGGNTFNAINCTPSTGHEIQFQIGTTTTVNIFNVNPTASAVLIRSTTYGTQATLSKASGSVNVSRVQIQDSNATGGAVWSATNSVNNGNNTGWLFPNYAHTAAITERFRPADTTGGVRTAYAAIVEPILSDYNTESVVVTFTAAISEGLTVNDVNDKDFASYAEVTESITLADVKDGVKVHNATAVEPANVADVAECFGFGTIDNTQDVVWVQVDNRQ